MATATANIASRASDVQRLYRSAASTIAGFGSPKMRPCATL